MIEKIYPSYTMLFTIFNLIYIFFKNKPYINWYWIILMFSIEYLLIAIPFMLMEDKFEKLKKNIDLYSQLKKVK